MQEFHLTVSSSGQIKIPPVLKKDWNLKTGDTLVLSGETGDFRLYKNPDVAKRMQALRRLQAKIQEIVPPDISLVDEFIAERRAEAKKERRKK